MLKNQVREQEYAVENVRAIQLAKLIFSRCFGELQQLNELKITKDYIEDNQLPSNSLATI
jgi:hypothetical protein